MFMLFNGYRFYPEGGIEDLEGIYDTLGEAVNRALEDDEYDWWHIYSITERKIVRSSYD